jgi:hypothetical protein
MASLFTQLMVNKLQSAFKLFSGSGQYLPAGVSQGFPKVEFSVGNDNFKIIFCNECAEKGRNQYRPVKQALHYRAKLP